MSLLANSLKILGLILIVLLLFFVVDGVRIKALEDSRNSDIKRAYEDGKAIAEIGCSLRISTLKDEKESVKNLCEAEKDVLEQRIKKLEDERNSIINSKPLFQRIAEGVANEHEYSSDYNCVDFTKELVKRLEEAGYETDEVEGYALWCGSNGNFHECQHAWTKVTVYIESTTGEILSPDKYKEMYKD